LTAAVGVRETPEALEGLSWALWWLDDAEALFDARERAFRSYRDIGAAASAARMATWLAADHLDFRGACSTFHPARPPLRSRCASACPSIRTDSQIRLSVPINKWPVSAKFWPRERV
jgi:hypothetical protein